MIIFLLLNVYGSHLGFWCIKCSFATAENFIFTYLLVISKLAHTVKWRHYKAKIGLNWVEEIALNRLGGGGVTFFFYHSLFGLQVLLLLAFQFLPNPPSADYLLAMKFQNFPRSWPKTPFSLNFPGLEKVTSVFLKFLAFLKTLQTLFDFQKSQTERGPECLCRIKPQGS